MISQGTLEAVARYRQAWRMVVSTGNEAKQRVWKEFGEATEKDFG